MGYKYKATTLVFSRKKRENMCNLPKNVIIKNNTAVFYRGNFTEMSPGKNTTAFVSLLVFFRIRRGTFPYSVEDDASTISQTPTTLVKLTIVTHLSFSERIAIANLFYYTVTWAINTKPLPWCSPEKNGKICVTCRKT